MVSPAFFFENYYSPWMANFRWRRVLAKSEEDFVRICKNPPHACVCARGEFRGDDRDGWVDIGESTKDTIDSWSGTKKRITVSKDQKVLSGLTCDQFVEKIDAALLSQVDIGSVWGNRIASFYIKGHIPPVALVIENPLNDPLN